MAIRLPVLALIGLSVCAQQPDTRVVHVAVTDSMHRFVTGLNRSHFVVRENGAERPVLSIATPDDPLAVAIVGDHAVPVGSSAQGDAELYFVRSLADALRSLASSTALRKALIITNADVPEGVSGMIFVQRVAPETTQKAVIEARCRYAVGFASADANETPAIELKQPSGLPTLKAVL